MNKPPVIQQLYAETGLWPRQGAPYKGPTHRPRLRTSSIYSRAFVRMNFIPGCLSSFNLETGSVSRCAWKYPVTNETVRFC